MKEFLLLLFSGVYLNVAQAQTKQVADLPAGRYEAFVKQTQNKWNKGDIILLDNSQYKISTSDDTGAYKFSATAQRVFFTSGPLKTVFAKTVLINNKPVIILPLTENSNQGMNLAASDVMATLRKGAD